MAPATASPVREALRCDLDAHRVLALSKGRPIPSERVAESYMFQVPHVEDDMRRVRQEARELMQVLRSKGSAAGTSSTSNDAAFFVNPPRPGGGPCTTLVTPRLVGRR